MDGREAASALAGVNGAERRLADQIGDCPAWRHAAFGGILALLNAGLALPLTLQSATIAIGMPLLLLIVQYDRRRYGVFVNGYRRGRTLPLTLLLLAGVSLLMIAQIWAREGGASDWVKAAIVAGAFLYATAGSVLWQRLFIAELQAGER